MNGVTPFIDSVMEDGGEMLVTRVMECKCLAKGSNCLVSTGLRPAVGIEVGVQSTSNSSMDVGTATKDGLRECGLDIGTCPVLTPCIKKLQLTFAEQAGLGDVD